MAADTNNPAADADGLFASGFPDAVQFWNSAASIADSKNYSPADAMAFLNQARAHCNMFTRAYQLPPPESGRPITTPIALFGEWCVYLLADMFDAEAGNSGNANGVAGGFAKLASLTTAGTPALRLDAAIDIARVATAWYNAPSNLPLFPSPIPPLPSQANSQQWMGFLEQGLNMAGMLAFAIPTAGAFIGGVLQATSALLHIFCPGPDPQSQAESIILNKVAAEFTQQEIQSAKINIDTASGFLVNLINILGSDAVTSLPMSAMGDWTENQISSQLDPVYIPQVRNALETLGSNDNVTVPGVIEALVYGISTYLALLRQKVVVDLTRAAVAKQYDPQNLEGAFNLLGDVVGDFVNFREAVVGDEVVPPVAQSGIANWACQLNDYLFQMVAGRLAQIQVDYLPPPLFEIGDKGSPKGTTQTVGKVSLLPKLPGKSQIALAKMQICYDFLQPYVASVAQALDASYDRHFQCIDSWIASIDQWAQMLPAITPDWAPTVLSWTAASPQGTVWIDGTKVRYAACYANAQCASPQGSWSEPVTVAGQALPMLQLQVDQVGSASCYYILRQIMPPGASDWNGVVYVGAPDMPPPATPANGGPQTMNWTDQDTTSVGSHAAAAVPSNLAHA